MTVIFKSRSVANQPKVLITASSIEHLLSSRYFRTYDYDKQFEIVVDGGSVMLRSSTDHSIVGLVGWVTEDKTED